MSELIDAAVRMDAEEAVTLLEDARDNLQAVISALDDAERMVPGSAGARIAQVRANVEIALGGDHEWLGDAMFTLTKSLEEVQELLDGDEDEDA